MDFSLLRAGIGYLTVFLLGSGAYYSFPKIIPPGNLKKSVNEIVLDICGERMNEWKNSETPSRNNNSKNYSLSEWMVCRNKLYCENSGEGCDRYAIYQDGYGDLIREEWEYTDFDYY